LSTKSGQKKFAAAAQAHFWFYFLTFAISWGVQWLTLCCFFWFRDARIAASAALARLRKAE
jgi:hypothetical protein